MTVFALTTAHKVGLGVVALVFIVFALVSSMVLPRRRPDFPGRSLGAFLGATVVLFAAMILAIVFFGRESKSGESALGKTAPTPTTTATTPGVATTSAAAAGTTPSTTAPSAGAVSQGRSIFASAGCSGCHTLKAAGASGTVGPNLDTLKPPEARIVKQVTNGGKIMPAFKGQLSPAQIQAVSAYVASVEGKG